MLLWSFVYHSPSPAPWSVSFDTILGHSLPMEGWPGASIFLEGSRGGGPGEAVEPSPSPDGDRLYLLHGTRYEKYDKYHLFY